MYTIQAITSKVVTTKYGPKPAYTVQANDEFFGYGFKKPTFNVGDVVDFKFTDSSYGKNVDLTSLRVISKGDGTTLPAPVVEAPVASSSRPYGPSPKPFPIPPLHGDRAIIRQNALTNARELLCNVTRNDTSCTRFEFLTLGDAASEVIRIARMFEAYSAGDLDLAEAMKTVE